MSVSLKQTVADFYNSDFFNDAEMLNKYLHPEMEIFWNARTGYSYMNRKEFVAMSQEAAKSFENVRAEITHLLEDKETDTVTVRLTFFVTTIERPDEENPVAHFMAIWEMKGGKLYRGFQISQPPEEDEKSLVSWRENS